MQDQLTHALKTHDVEYADIRIEDVTESWVRFRGPDLDSIGSSRTVGGVVRALYRGGWGYATFNDLSDLPQRVKEACKTARLVGKEQTFFAPVEQVVAEVPAKMEKDFRQVPLADKKALTEEYNKIILGHDSKIQTSAIYYGDRFKTVWYANSQGSYIKQEKPNIYMFLLAIARQDDIVQQAFEMNGGFDGYQSVENLHEKSASAAHKAVELLSAPPVTGGKYTVITDPLLTGVFTHEAFGHLSESDFVYENPRMQDLMQLGKRFGVDGLNIIDDGSLEGGLGTHPYDDEGVAMRKNYLIKEGILVGRLHSRETAAKMGEQPTGNARAVAFQHPPIVRMTNTYIEAGKDSFEDMLKDIKLGVLAVGDFGGQTAMEMFTFSAGYGYMIRDGQVAELVRDVVLTGNVFETLLHIDKIGNQVGWNPNGPGGCGKGNQHPLRVGLGGPYVRIQDCVIGGQQ